MDGMLQKQRKHKTWTWKSYYFVLEDDQLSYFKDKSKSSSRGLIDLAQAQSVEMTGASTKGFPFEIVTNSRSHLLAASTAELRKQWLRQCRHAMSMSFRRATSLYRPSCDSISDDDFDEDILNDLRRLGTAERTQEEISTSPLNAPRKESGLRRKPAIRSTSSTSVSGYSDEDEVFAKEPARGRRDHNSVCSVESITSVSESASSGEVEEVSKAHEADKNEPVTKNGVSKFPPIPSLPHPRMELTHRTAFDDIRLFLANNRRSDEVFPTPRRTQMRGKSIELLKAFLDSMT